MEGDVKPEMLAMTMRGHFARSASGGDAMWRGMRKTRDSDLTTWQFGSSSSQGCIQGNMKDDNITMVPQRHVVTNRETCHIIGGQTGAKGSRGVWKLHQELIETAGSQASESTSARHTPHYCQP